MSTKFKNYSSAQKKSDSNIYFYKNLNMGNQFDRILLYIFHNKPRSCSSMDRTLVSGTEDLGSTPSGSASMYWRSSLSS